MTRLGELLNELRRRLAAAGLEGAGQDARLLVSGILGLSTTDLVTAPDRPVSEEDVARVEHAALRRLAHEPVHRILGHREFYGLDLALSGETLEPRPDTEILVERALPYLREKAAPQFIDFGTGTGAIALALLSACRGARGVGVDLSADALRTAMANAERLGLNSRFSVVQSDWAREVRGKFDMIVSNPPYIATDVIAGLAPEVRLFDPILALDGGDDGLDAYRRLAAEAPALLLPDGVVALEIGYDQKESVSLIFGRNGFTLLESARDLGGQDRVLVFRLPT